MKLTWNISVSLWWLNDQNILEQSNLTQQLLWSNEKKKMVHNDEPIKKKMANFMNRYKVTESNLFPASDIRNTSVPTIHGAQELQSTIRTIFRRGRERSNQRHLWGWKGEVYVKLQSWAETDRRRWTWKRSKALEGRIGGKGRGSWIKI